MKIKPGYKTSEFWFTLVSFIFSGLYLTGLISENSHKEELITTVSHAVESVILISGQFLIFYKYIKGRSEVKKIAETEQPQILEIEEPSQIKKTRKTKNVAKRTGTGSSRNNNSTNKRVSKKSKKDSPK